MAYNDLTVTQTSECMDNEFKDVPRSIQGQLAKCMSYLDAQGKKEMKRKYYGVLPQVSEMFKLCETKEDLQAAMDKACEIHRYPKITINKV